MVYVAKAVDVSAPLLGSILASNDAHIQRVLEMVLERGKRQVSMLGLSFKAGSDDLRESPFVRLAEGLIGKGVPLRIYDPDVSMPDVFGQNRAYVDERLPHVGRLMTEDLGQAVAGTDVVIVGKQVAGVDELRRLLRTDQTVIDLIGIAELGDVVRPWAGAWQASSGDPLPVV